MSTDMKTDDRTSVFFSPGLRFRLLLGACFSMSLALPVFGQTVETEMLSADTVEDEAYSSTVTAQRPSPPGTVKKIDAAEISLRGARNLPDVLATEPAVEVNRSPKAGATLQIRGFDEKSILVLFEGIPIREVYDGHFDISSLPVFSFDSITLETGVTSLLYGTNSAGGILKMNASSRCTDTLDLRLYGRPFEQDAVLYGGRAHACLQINDVKLWAGVGTERSDGYPLSDDYEQDDANASYHEEGGIRDGSDYQRSSIALVGRYAPAPHKALTLFADAVRSPRSVPPFEGYGYTRYWRFERYNTLLVGISGTYGPDTTPTQWGFRRLFARLYTHVHRDELRDYEDATYQTLTRNSLAWFVASAYANETVGASIQGEWTLNTGNQLDLSLQYDFDLHRQREIPVPKGDDPLEWTSWEKYSAQRFTAAFEDTQVLGPWRLNVGFSGGGMSLVAQEIRDKSYPVDNRLIPALEGRIGIEYSKNDRFRALAVAGHKVRLPMLKELYSNAIGGNPNLDAERAWMGEIGFDTDDLWLRGLHSSVRVFANAVRSLIEKYRDAYGNVGRAVIAGVDLELRFRPVDLLEFYTGYRYLYARDLAYDRPLDNRTPHRVVLGERVFFKFGLTLTVEAIFNSGQQSYYADPAVGDWVEDSLSPYTVLNAHIRYEPTFEPLDGLYLFADGTNLLDVDYCNGSFEPRAGREIILGIGARI
jgi:outer membrane cobalamin receptor